MVKVDSDNLKGKTQKEMRKPLSRKQLISIVCIVITTVVIFLAFAIPFFVHGNTDIIAGGNPINLEKAGSSIYYILALRNNGFGQSNDVKLHIHFSEGISIDYEYANETTEPRHDDLEIISNYECYYKWNYLNSGEIAALTLKLSIDSELGTYIVPLDISVRESKG